MAGFLGEYYLWVKAAHVIAVIAFMAGMLYLPRLFVYHCATEAGFETSETFKVMERRLLRAIINPALILATILGFMMVAHLDAWSEGWMLAKFALLFILGALHGRFSRWRRDFAEDKNQNSAKFYRWMNEAPTVIMVGIVILVIVKPF